MGAIIVERDWAAPWMNIYSRMGLDEANVGGVIIYRVHGRSPGTPAPPRAYLHDIQARAVSANLATMSDFARVASAVPE